MSNKNPSTSEIKAARLKSGLSQTKAAALVGYSMRSWQSWEAGKRTMRRVVLDQFIALTR